MPIYEGNPYNWPEGVTHPDDGAARTASTVNVPLEGYGDRTAWTRAHGVFVDFRDAVTVPGTPSLNGGFYDHVQRRWYVFGPSRNLRDALRLDSWATDTVIDAGTGTENLSRADVDDDANFVVSIHVTTSVFTWDGASWAKVNVTGPNTVELHPQIAYDADNDRWCYAAIDDGGTYYVYTSTNRSAWTIANYAGLGVAATTHLQVRLACDRESGRLVLFQYDTATTFEIAVSDDGGQTWTHTAEHETAITGATQLHLAFNAATGKWLLIISDPDGPTCEVWSSANGSDWTLVKTDAGAALYHAAPLGGIWVAAAKTALYDGELVYSSDDGATWRVLGLPVGADVVGVFGGGGAERVIAVMGVGGAVHVSLRAGLSGQEM